MKETLLDKLQHGEKVDDEEPWGVVYTSTDDEGNLIVRTFHNLDDPYMWLNGVIIGLAHLATSDPVQVTKSYLDYIEKNPEEDDDPEETAEDLPEWAKNIDGEPN